MSSVTDAYQTFERGTPAGDVLFRLYGGKKAMPSMVDPVLLRRARANKERRELAEANKPVPIPKSRAHISVPRNMGKPSVADDSAPRRHVYLPMRPGRKPQAASKDIVIGIERDREAQPAPVMRHITDADKDKLVEFMQYNGEKPPTPPPAPKPRTPPRPKTELENLRELFAEISQEVDERKEFMDQMRELGKSKQYEKQIKLEVGERVQQLRRLDAMIREEEQALR
eukprot:Hpha_TRINITY_DN12390_c0_g2::TRINITY_DN12390_c0_g2_i1::g.155830::m.155830